jgi:hypothetical protein
MKTLLAVALAFSFAFPALAQDNAPDKPTKKYKMLVITQSKGFVHGAVKRPNPETLSTVEIAMKEVGQSSGLFDAECSQDATIITPDKLKELDVIFFYTTGGLPISSENWAAFDAWLKSGKGFLGYHSATDTALGEPFKGEPNPAKQPYTRLINGQFAGHPWNQGTPIVVAVHEPSHTTMKPFGQQFNYKEEIYQYKDYDPNTVRVLMSLDMEKTPLKMPWHVPVAWTRSHGSGRIFYNNMGHTPETWKDPMFRESLVAATRFVLKLDDGPTDPNPDLQHAENLKAFLVVAIKEGHTTITDIPAALEKLKFTNTKNSWYEQTSAAIQNLKNFDAKRDAEKRTAEMKRIAAEIQKMVG